MQVDQSKYHHKLYGFQLDLLLQFRTCFILKDTILSTICMSSMIVMIDIHMWVPLADKVVPVVVLIFLYFMFLSYNEENIGYEN